MKLMKNKNFEAAFNDATVGILIADSTNHITLVNPFLLSLFGYKDENELRGKTVKTLIPRHLRLEHGTNNENYPQAHQNKPVSVCTDMPALKKDGTQFSVDIIFSHYKK